MKLQKFCSVVLLRCDEALKLPFQQSKIVQFPHNINTPFNHVYTPHLNLTNLKFGGFFFNVFIIFFISSALVDSWMLAIP